MKTLILLILALLILPIKSFSQVDVTATSGTTAATYSNLSSAFVAINNATHQGDIVITINANTTNFGIILNASGTGGASYSSLKIRPGILGPINVDNNIGGSTFLFNGVDNMTIDGTLPGGYGPLTFRSIQNSFNSVMLYLYNDAQNDTVRNCFIQSNSGYCISIASPATSSGNKNIVIAGNDIGNVSGSAFPQYGIYSSFTSDNITVSENRIHDVLLQNNICGGIYVAGGGSASNWKIKNNSIYYSVPFSPIGSTQIYGIFTQGISNTCEITGNIIGYTDTTKTSPATISSSANTTFTGITSVATQTGTIIRNNVIDGFDFTTGIFSNSVTGSWCGINFTTFYDSYIDSNRIGKTSGASSVKITHNSGTAFATGMYFSNFGGNVYVRNNTFGSIEVSGSLNTVVSKFYAINIQSSSTFNIQNNIIGDSSSIASPNSISVGTLTTTVNSIFSGLNIEQGVFPPMNFRNNIIRNCRARTNSDSAVCYGMKTNGNAGTFSVTDNTIKDLEARSSSTGSSKVYGIYYLSSNGTPCEYRRNQVNSLSSVCGTGARSGAMGMFISTPNFGITCDSNIVHDINTNSCAAGITGGAVGIYAYANCTNNKIYNIINTNATVNNVYAVGLFAGGADNRRNLVYDIKTQTSNISTIEGIRFTGNYLVCNVVSLGSGITTDPAIKAINDSSFQAKIIVYNSIYIGGTQSSNVTNTAGYYINFATNTQLYNNIFYNARASTGATNYFTGRHYGIKTNFSGFSSLIISYNNITSLNNGGMFIGSSNTEIANVSDFKSYTSGNGAFCFSSDPQYNNPGSSPPDLTLPMNNKQSNGGSRLNAFFNTDFNGNSRALPSTNRPDMGAFEADYGDPTIDLQEPYIYYGQLSQDLVTNNSRTLTNFVWISDNKSPSNTNTPRVYFKRSDDPNANLPVATNSSSDPMGWRYNSGTTSDAGSERYYSFVIDYSIMNPSSTLTGDATNIQYFVSAEDEAGNFNSNGYGAYPGTPLVNVTSQPSGYIYNYQLRLGIQGTYYIKAGGFPLYNSFAEFSNYYSNGIITGDITLILGGDISGNDQIGLTDGSGNQNPNNYKVTIRPDGNTVRTMENNDNAFVSYNINMYNIKNLTIDGRSPNTGTGKYLRFVNNVSSTDQSKAIVYYATNAHKNTIRNCIFESNATSDPVVLYSSFTGTTGCDSNTISNCDFKPSNATYPGRYRTGIYFANTFGNDSGCTATKIDSCDFVDFSSFCISMDKAASNQNVTISHNKFHQSANYGASIFPLRFQAYGTNLISDNEIYDTYTNQTVYGMYILEAQNTTITRNKINIAPNSSTNGLYGIYLLSAGTFNSMNITNNQIRIQPTGGDNQPIVGINDQGSTTTVNILYNTVYIGGQSTGTANTYCAFRENPFFNSSTWVCQNNIFYNDRTAFSGSGLHFAMGNKNLDYGLFSNYNFFVGRGQFDAWIFENAGSSISFYNWRLASFGRDANSISRIANTINPSNFFQDAFNCDLRIKSNYAESYYVKGMGYPATTPSVATDYNGTPRSTSLTTGATTIGAFEVAPGVEPNPIIISGPFDIGQEYPIYDNERYYGTIKFNSAVQPSGLALYYYGGTNPPNASGSYGNSYFKIIPSGTNAGLDYDLKLAFDERELNNITAPASSNLGLAKSEDNGTTWTFIQGSMYDNNGNFTGAIAHNQTSFSLFTFTGLDNALPVELSAFNSSVNRNDVTLKWTTTSERNSANFEIERKLSSTENWSKVGSLSGAGNSNTPKSYTFDDRRLQIGKYKYRLKQIDYNGTFKYYDLHNEIEVGLPKDFRMSQNYPNPFNPTSKIDYELPFDSKVEIRIYDMTGREMNVLVNQQQTAGYYTIQFNGAGFASGTYFYRIAAKSTSGKDFSKTLKMVLVK
ncbi:MAG: T9SS type A sorting domain-containing protein [Bacteroidetes bacterium]|nr:T9SS type A sorting domain-containing protein [Bacteroidota bacterium]